MKDKESINLNIFFLVIECFIILNFYNFFLFLDVLTNNVYFIFCPYETLDNVFSLPKVLSKML